MDDNELENQTEQPEDPTRRQWLGGVLAAGTLPFLPNASLAELASLPGHGGTITARLKKEVKNVVVIYQENRSFNNLFADFPGLLSPLSALTPKDYKQIDRDGRELSTLPPVWGGLVPRGQMIGGKQYAIGEDKITGLANAPFLLKDAEGNLLPDTVITRDLVHEFYHNQMQINGGKNNQFVAWADTGAMVMGRYQGKNLNLWNIARQYTLCDRFFMAAFGGSFLNHQFLISARAPVYPNVHESPAKGKVAVLTDGPQGYRLAVSDKSPASAMEGPPRFVNVGAMSPDGYAVNTMFPPYQPSVVAPPKGEPSLASREHPSTLPPQDHLTIGDLLSQKNVSWAWYGGGWQAALEGNGGPDQPNFQPHHQPFNYFKQFAPGTKQRTEHLRDGGLGDSPISNHFIADAVAGKLPEVAFYKPQGNLNMHAGYANVTDGDAHVANVLQHLMRSPQWKNMVVIITVDENGGWWDHVAPPTGDRWGPGSRIPAIVVSPMARKGFVDHSFYDTTSIIRFLMRRYDLPALEGIKERDAAFREHRAEPPGDLTNALDL